MQEWYVISPFYLFFAPKMLITTDPLPPGAHRTTTSRVRRLVLLGGVF